MTIGIIPGYNKGPTNKEEYNMSDMNKKTAIRDELMNEISGGQIINREQLQDFVRRMKAYGHSKADVVGTITTEPEISHFSTSPWADVKDLYTLVSQMYDQA